MRDHVLYMGRTSETSAGDRLDAGHGGAAIHVAVVHGPRSVNFMAVAGSTEGLRSKVGAYVAGQAELQLYRDVAVRVRGLIGAGDVEAGIRLYFASVGERWDREWLVTEAFELQGGAADHG